MGVGECGSRDFRPPPAPSQLLHHSGTLTFAGASAGIQVWPGFRLADPA